MYKHHFLFGRKNYLFMLVGIGVIALGYLLMAGGASDDPNVYPEAAIYGFLRTVLAPIICLIGFGIEIAAIFWRDNTQQVIYQTEKEKKLPLAPKVTPIVPTSGNKPLNPTTNTNTNKKK